MPTLLGQELGKLLHREGQRLELAHLVVQQFESRVAIPAGRLEFGQAGSLLLPPIECSAHGVDQLFVTTVRIDERALRGPAHQGKKFLLAVNVDEQLTEFAQGLQRHRLTIDERARAAVTRQYASQDALAFALDGLCLETASELRVRTQVESCRDLSALRSVANRIAACPPAGRECEGIDHD